MSHSDTKPVATAAVDCERKLPLCSETEIDIAYPVIDEPDTDVNTRARSKYWRRLANVFKVTRSIPLVGRKSSVNGVVPKRDSLLRKFSIPQISGDIASASPADGEAVTKRRFTYSNGIPIKGSDDPNFSKSFSHRLIFNPEGVVLFAWLGLVAAAWLYSVWALIVRQAFKELREGDHILRWLILDYSCDFVFALDILVQLRTGFLENGLLVCDSKKLADHYIRSSRFFLDFLCLAPVDLVYLSMGSVLPVCRVPRFLKAYRAKQFYRKAESATSYPNAWRGLFLGHTMMLVMHWFACFYYMISESEGFHRPEGVDRGWAYPMPNDNSTSSVWFTLQRKYLHSIYWACLTLTTIGEKNSPSTDLEYICSMTGYFLGIFVFATVVGQVGNVIANKNVSRQEFERMVDNAKTFMKTRNVPSGLQTRILRWYDYSWSRGALSGSYDINCLSLMPESLKVELAVIINLNTLRKVSIFKEAQPEFLYELVLKMKSCIYTPKSFVCRKGEVATEMFVVNHGILEVVTEDGSIKARLKAGDIFGEIGVLNIVQKANRRVANVISVGYAEVFTLAASDVKQAVNNHPEAKHLLTRYGCERLGKPAYQPKPDSSNESIENEKSTFIKAQDSTKNVRSRRQYFSDNKRRFRNLLKSPVHRSASFPSVNGAAQLLAESVTSKILADMTTFSNRSSRNTDVKPTKDDSASTSEDVKKEQVLDQRSEYNEEDENDTNMYNMQDLIQMLQMFINNLEAKRKHVQHSDGNIHYAVEENDVWQIIELQKKELIEEKAKVALLKEDVKILMEQLQSYMKTKKDEDAKQSKTVPFRYNDKAVTPKSISELITASRPFSKNGTGSDKLSSTNSSGGLTLERCVKTSFPGQKLELYPLLERGTSESNSVVKKSKEVSENFAMAALSAEPKENEENSQELLTGDLENP